MRRSFRARWMLLVPFLFIACDAQPEADAPGLESPAGDAAATAAGNDADAAAATDELLDPNDATTEQLATIPGIDAALAQQIVAGRPYDNMLEVDSVLAATLDEAQRDEVYARLFKPIDLNTATGEEIQLIPGVGDRMQHEFEEYRPYSAIEQFRREIGKYVNDEEVARLEKYVTINE